MDPANKSHFSIESTTPQRSAVGLSAWRSGHAWEARNPSTTYTRSGAVAFTIGESRSSDLWSYQWQFADTVSWSLGKHYLRLGGSVIHHRSGGTGSEPGTAVLGTFTFRSSTTAPFNQLTLADVQNYTQPINFGISSYNLPQWLLTGFVQDSFRVRRDLTLDLGLRYDLGRGVTVYGDTATAAPSFGWFTPASAIGADGHAIPAFANIDPSRMFQLQVRIVF